MRETSTHTTSRIHLSTWLLLLAAVCFSSCARYKAFTNPVAPPHKATTPTTADSLSARIYLIGDIAGGKPTNTPVLKDIQQRLQQAGDKSTLLFLGDQMAQAYLPEEEVDGQAAVTQAKAKKRLADLLAPFREISNHAYFLPGDRDWGRIGPVAIDEQEKLFADFIL
ncbi:MAG: hypothetical protein AAFO94_15120 [Bacteroidota bacterium]